MDVYEKEKRSEVMSKSRSKNSKSTEMKLIKIFKDNNISLVWKNGFLFLKQKIAVFVDGYFWHGHDCRNVSPKQNSEYWQAKRIRNKERDIEVTKHIENLGWRVIRIWECELKGKRYGEKNRHTTRTC